MVRDETTFRVAVWLTGHARDLKAGEYRFTAAQSAVQVVETIARGAIYTQPVTFREGLTIAEMADVYQERGLGSRAAFLAAAGDASLVRDLDPQATDLEGYLFPDTYPVPRQAPAPALVAQMVRGFRAALPAAQVAAAAAQGLTVRQVVTLAALVEKETAQDAERPLVAAVYRNRLRVGMPMQADPTVIFALQRAGRWNGNLTRDDLTFDSPYNTYRYAGLPPGPIAAPGRRALDAVVAPAAVDYLYFVSRNDGTHVFATTLAGAQPQRLRVAGQVLPRSPGARAGRSDRRRHLRRIGRRHAITSWRSRAARRCAATSRRAGPSRATRCSRRAAARRRARAGAR